MLDSIRGFVLLRVEFVCGVINDATSSFLKHSRRTHFQVHELSMQLHLQVVELVAAAEVRADVRPRFLFVDQLCFFRE